MGECEVCGNGEERFVVLIEGAKMRVCGDCAKRGKILASAAPPAPKRPGALRGPSPAAREVELVSDCADRIRRAREKMHVGTDVLAERVFETESYLKRVENGDTEPNEALARKLEKELGITLFEASEEDSRPSGNSRSGPVTLGDLITVKRKQGKR